MINPFSCNTESLVNVAAGVVLPQDVADSLLASRPKGQEQMTTFVKKRINSHDVSFWDSIPNLKIKTFSSMSKQVKVKYGDDKSITVHADVFSLLYFIPVFIFYPWLGFKQKITLLGLSQYETVITNLLIIKCVTAKILAYDSCL